MDATTRHPALRPGLVQEYPHTHSGNPNLAWAAAYDALHADGAPEAVIVRLEDKDPASVRAVRNTIRDAAHAANYQDSDVPGLILATPWDVFTPGWENSRDWPRSIERVRLVHGIHAAMNDCVAAGVPVALVAPTAFLTHGLSAHADWVSVIAPSVPVNPAPGSWYISGDTATRTPDGDYGGYPIVIDFQDTPVVFDSTRLIGDPAFVALGSAAGEAGAAYEHVSLADDRLTELRRACDTIADFTTPQQERTGPVRLLVLETWGEDLVSTEAHNHWSTRRAPIFTRINDLLSEFVAAGGRVAVVGTAPMGDNLDPSPSTPWAHGAPVYDDGGLAGVVPTPVTGAPVGSPFGVHSAVSALNRAPVDPTLVRSALADAPGWLVRVLTQVATFGDTWAPLEDVAAAARVTPWGVLSHAWAGAPMVEVQVGPCAGDPGASDPRRFADTFITGDSDSDLVGVCSPARVAVRLRADARELLSAEVDTRYNRALEAGELVPMLDGRLVPEPMNGPAEGHVAYLAHSSLGVAVTPRTLTVPCSPLRQWTDMPTDGSRLDPVALDFTASRVIVAESSTLGVFAALAHAAAHEGGWNSQHLMLDHADPLTLAAAAHTARTALTQITADPARPCLLTVIDVQEVNCLSSEWKRGAPARLRGLVDDLNQVITEFIAAGGRVLAAVPRAARGQRTHTTGWAEGAARLCEAPMGATGLAYGRYGVPVPLREDGTWPARLDAPASRAGAHRHLHPVTSL